jgi:hypothetical protein
MTGITAEEFSHSALICTGADYVIEHLLKSPEELDDGEKALCEYAAATAAVYDYSFELCIKQTRVMSGEGTVSLQRADRAVRDSAYAMRCAAFSRLAAAGLIRARDFAFMGV